MLAMLRKDWYVMGRYTAYLLLSWLLAAWAAIRFLVSDSGFLYGMLPVFSLTISLNSVSTDEGLWDRFAAVTPLRPWQIVLAKYLFGYGCLAVMTVLAALAGGSGVELWGAAAITPLVLAMALPLLYRLGRRKGSAVLLFFWGLAAAAILGTAHFRYDLIESAFGWIEDVPVPLLAAGGGAALLALSAGSVLLSTRFYTRRLRGWYDQS